MESAYLADKEANPESPFVLHFRIATSGERDELNTHPHKVGDDLYMVHNGIMSSWAKGEKKSDTVHFTEEVLSALYGEYGGSNFLMSAPVTYLLEEALGTYNKMVFMSPKNVFILNQKLGTWVGGVWFSNTHFVPLPAYTPPAGGYQNGYHRPYYGHDKDGYYGADGSFHAWPDDEKKKSTMETTNGQKSSSTLSLPAPIVKSKSTTPTKLSQDSDSAKNAGMATSSKNGIIISYSPSTSVDKTIYATIKYEHLSQVDTITIKVEDFEDGTIGYTINLEDFFIEDFDVCFPDYQKAKTFIYMMAIGVSYARV